MTRIALFFFALIASVLLALASPVPVVNGELVDIKKRQTRTGRGTWFSPGLGNCGKTDGDGDLILAIGKQLYDRTGGSHCNQMVKIVANGKTAYGKTRDSCQSCSDNDIDMSPALFQKFAPLDTGVLKVSWSFM